MRTDEDLEEKLASIRAEFDAKKPDSSGATDDAPVEKTLAQRLLSRSDIANLPKPEPLIDNVLDQGTTVHLYGTWGTAKTFLAIDWAASVATGRDWQGRETEQRKVLYVVAEGAQGFRGRLDAWETAWRTKISDEWIQFLPVPVNLTDNDDVTELCALVGNGGYGLVVLDTLSRCMVGADENSAQAMGLAVDAMTRMVRYTPDERGVVLDVHHTGKDEKTSRGSSVIEAGADTCYFMSRDEQLYTVQRTKRKDGPQQDMHTFRLDIIEGTESAVLSGFTGGKDVGISQAKQRVFSQFVSLFSETGATRTQIVNSIDMPPTTVYRAINDLLKDGALVKEGSGTRGLIRLPS